MTMRAFSGAAMCVVLLSCFSHAKSTFSSFSWALALPVGNTSAMTLPYTNWKRLDVGWDAGMTFFGKPFLKLDNASSDLALGGKISYSRWKRDSTLTPVTFLGMQGILRYFIPSQYLPPMIEPFDLFAQAGGGLFIGEYGFTSPDTTDWSQPPAEVKVTEGKKYFGMNVGVGINWNVIEIMPVVTMVFTNKPSMWLSISAGMTF
ncbi:MAG: hypothetical protein JXA18_04490 [Chitinispirillaceae bacterium]|nr:hypothetical protein [Chitinispirillaceae bacterium]